jgi:TRAP-type C4-dicarboxylate transport system permease small subunit
MSKFEKVVRSISNYFNWIAGAALVIMLLWIVADIIGNKLFSWPVPGSIEMVSFLGVIVIGFSIAYTQVLRGHIEVEFVVMRLPQKVQSIIQIIVYILSLALFIVLSWRSLVYAFELRASGEVSMTQEIPFYPFVLMLALCCLVVCLVLIVQILRLILDMRNR